MKRDILKKSFMHLIFLVIIILLVTACGGEASPESSPPEEVTLEEATTVPATTTAIPEPTSLPSGSESEPEATDTTVPTPTTMPTLAPEPTVETAAETAVSTAQTACDHPYFPMREGATWTYEGNSGQLIWTVTSVEGDLENATATMRADVAGVVLNYIWDCTPEGMASFDFASLGTDYGFTLDLEPISMTGQFLLPAEQLTTGATWQLIMDVTVTGDIEGEPINGDLIHTQNTQILNTDPVTFEGLTTDGIFMERISIIDVTMNVSGISVSSPPITLDASYSMGRGIGITEMITTFPGETDTFRLISYSIP